MTDIDFSAREMIAVNLKVTGIQTSFKKDSPMTRFSGVRVSATTQRKASNSEFYNVSVPTDSLVITPGKGQIWSLKGFAHVEVKQSKRHPSLNDKHISLHRPKKCTFILPQHAKSFVDFIAGFDRIGDKIAERLWSKFQLKTFNVLENKDTEQLETVEGVTPKKASILVDGYEKFGNLKYATWLTQKKIPVEIQRQVFRLKQTIENENGVKVEVDPTTMIEQNPYSLMSFGLNFTKTDKIARIQFNIPKTDPGRLVAAVSGALQAHARNGHTIASTKDLMGKLSSDRLLGWEEQAKHAINQAYTNKEFIYDLNNDTYQYTPIYLWENVVALRLLKLKQHRDGELYHAMAKQHCNSIIEHENAKLATIGPTLKLQEKQVVAINQSVGNAVSCIVGGAGTGKTTVLKSVLAVYKKLGYTIKTMALSARAAMRAQECIESLELIATSIAKFLHESPLENPHEKYLVVIDEASMLDLPTMYRIVINTDPRVRFLLVGDSEQLPPIGCGKILTDIIHSDVISYTELDVVQRQDESTGIPAWADFVKRGVVPPKLSIANIHFHNVSFADVSKKCVDLYALAPAASRVIASTNALVAEINQLCQPESSKTLNGCSETIYLNDPILFNENNYDEEIQNGTLGKLIAVEPVGLVQIEGTEKEVCLTPELLTIISPAYALTAHKAQGSQFPRVIVAMSPGNNIDRSWFYTAITRAEVELHIVCTKQKLFSAITNPNSASLRKTNLVPLLQAKS